MMKAMDVDVWVRGTDQARTESMTGVPENAAAWTDADVRCLLTEMLLALERAKNPGGAPPPVVLRGFSWIVTPEKPTSPGSAAAASGQPSGVLVHLEMKMGTASAGPFAIGEDALSSMITRVMAAPNLAPTVH
jgi:hypothetical protein